MEHFLTTASVTPTITHKGLTGNFIFKSHSRVRDSYALLENKSLKGTLTQIWKSPNIFAFIWKYYDEDFRFKHLLLFEIRAREIFEKFIYKHSETIEYVKN